jgi:rod shape-determining protein MreB
MISNFFNENFSKINLSKELFFEYFSNDIGIDLGTSNALVFIKGIGVVINEPSVVAFNNKTGMIVAVGHEAKEMIGRTPDHITAERPIVDGVISNFEIAGEMIAYLINKAEREHSKKFVIFGPRAVIGVPSGVTNVESRAVRDAGMDAGARKVYVVEEPAAAAIGDNRPINEARGTIIVDIGGGTTDIAVLSLNGLVSSKKITIAGDKFNKDIENYIKEKHKILIGENTAEKLKINIGSVVSKKDKKDFAMGRDLTTGTGKKIEVTSTDMKNAIKSSIGVLIDTIKDVLETTPPEILSDAIERGIYLSGGGALLDGLPALIQKETNLPVHVVSEPLFSVVNGTGIILENMERYMDTILRDEDEGSIQI